MLRDLLNKHGLEKLNTFTKYPSIKTLHTLGAGEMITNELNLQVTDEEWDSSEKIDGTNVRLLYYGSEYIIGSRLLLLNHCDDIFHDPTQGIVTGMKKIVPNLTNPGKINADKLVVIYGEFFGGKTTNNAKNYGKEENGFRVFDVVVHNTEDLEILNRPLAEISRWREHENDLDNSIVYGQRFIPREEAMELLPEFEFVPEVDFTLKGTSHEEVLESLKLYIPETNVALTDSALKKPEGIIIRNKSRSKIFKIRYDDYERAIRKK